MITIIASFAAGIQSGQGDADRARLTAVPHTVAAFASGGTWWSRANPGTATSPSSSRSGAMLLERLDPQRTLFDIPLDLAIPIAGEIVRTLAVAGDAGLPMVGGLAAEIACTVPERWERLGRPILVRLIDQANDLATALDAGLTRAWNRVRVVDFWLWELSVGLTDDPGGCATIVDWLEQR